MKGAAAAILRIIARHRASKAKRVAAAKLGICKWRKKVGVHPQKPHTFVTVAVRFLRTKEFFLRASIRQAVYVYRQTLISESEHVGSVQKRCDSVNYLYKLYEKKYPSSRHIN